jgi:hypothetical protein
MAGPGPLGYRRPSGQAVAALRHEQARCSGRRLRRAGSISTEEGPLVADIPMPGTWVQLAHAGAPVGSWHHVSGYDPADGSLRFDCSEPDISWAIDGTASWAVSRSSLRPQADLCRACGFRTAFDASSALSALAVR